MSDREKRRDALTSEDQALLRDIVLRRAPALASLLNEMSVRQLTEDQQNELRGIVGDELAATGYLGTPESDMRGVRLDDLIDALTHV